MDFISSVSLSGLKQKRWGIFLLMVNLWQPLSKEIGFLSSFVKIIFENRCVIKAITYAYIHFPFHLLLGLDVPQVSLIFIYLSTLPISYIHCWLYPLLSWHLLIPSYHLVLGYFLDLLPSIFLSSVLSYLSSSLFSHALLSYLFILSTRSLMHTLFRFTLISVFRILSSCLTFYYS